MKLFIHIGIHKTGSSFLQTVFFDNIDYLISQGIFFPGIKKDYAERKGVSFNGNALALSKALIKGDFALVSQMVKGWVAESNAQNCESILLSNEGLLVSFAKKGTLVCFNEILLDNGIDEVQGLFFLRNPESHILSLYRHHGDRGEILDLKNWVNMGYPTFTLLNDFLSNKEALPFLWTARKYKSDTGYMLEATFNNWLGIDAPIVHNKKRVNVSLSLSEIAMIRELNKSGMRLKVEELKQKLQSVPIEMKPKEIQLKNFYSQTIRQYLNQNAEIIYRLNKELPDGEKLQITKGQEELLNSELEQISLSPIQLQYLIEISRKTISWKLRLKRILSPVISLIRK
jgi:hypothetical protein